MSSCKDEVDGLEAAPLLPCRSDGGSTGLAGVRVDRWSLARMGSVSRAELLVRVRELRARGLSPKQVARELGMKPAEVAPRPDFAGTVPYLGPAPQSCPIRFGRDGMPFYVSGPRDNPRQVIAALETTAGSGNYHYIAGL